jgi:hypothetical protein
VTVQGNQIFVDCPGRFEVYAGDHRPKLMYSGRESFHDDKFALPFNIKSWKSNQWQARDLISGRPTSYLSSFSQLLSQRREKPQATVEIVRDQPEVKTYGNLEQAQRTAVSFDKPFVKIICPAMHSVNIRTQYMPEKDRSNGLPKPQPAKRYSSVHLKVAALSRPSFFRFMKQTAALFRKLWGVDSDVETKSARYQSFTFNRYVSEQMSTHVNQVPMFSGLPADAYGMWFEFCLKFLSSYLLFSDVTEVGNPRVWSANVLTLKDNLVQKTKFGQTLKNSIDPEWYVHVLQSIQSQP